MKRLRWLLAFALFCAVAVANPLAAAPHEASESAEEMVHLAGHRRVARVQAPDRDASPTATHRGVEQVVRRGAGAPGARVRTARAQTRKVPPRPGALSASSSTSADDPDAH